MSAALAGTSMSFTSGKHSPNDFSALGDAARKEAVKKGTAYMNVWMYAVREFEDAIDDCTRISARTDDLLLAAPLLQSHCCRDALLLRVLAA